MKLVPRISEYAMTFEEIGAALGISPAAAKETCYRGLRKLAKDERLKGCARLAEQTICFKENRQITEPMW